MSQKKQESIELSSLSTKRFSFISNVDKEKNKKKKSVYIFLPTSSIRSSWDFIILILLLYICLVVPFILAFGLNNNIFTLFDYILDVCFIIDVLVNFNTAYTNIEGKLITDRKEIAKHYIFSWFLLDFFTSIPFNWFQTGTLSKAKYAKILRIFKLAKMVRVSKAARIIKKITRRFSN